jgi:hypothetical protein
METYQTYLVVFLVGIILGGVVGISLLSGFMRMYRGGMMGYAGMDGGVVVAPRNTGFSLVVGIAILVLLLLYFVRNQSIATEKTAPKMEQSAPTSSAAMQVNQKPLLASMRSSKKMRTPDAPTKLPAVMADAPIFHLQLSAFSKQESAQKYLEQSTQKLPTDCWIAYHPTEVVAYKIWCGRFASAAAARQFARRHQLRAFPVARDEFSVSNS